jgi:hypothetical protein
LCYKLGSQQFSINENSEMFVMLRPK